MSTTPLISRFWQRSTVGSHVAITTSSDSKTTVIGQNSLSIRIGRLETAASDPACSLIILPANEYFDDDCVADPKSALGAFVQVRLRSRIDEFQREVSSQLAHVQGDDVDVGGQPKRRYALGSAVYLNHPLKETQHLLVVAATTQRPREGLKGDTRALFTIAATALETARDNRLPCVYQPLIGAGHGGLNPRRALLAQLIAWSELLFAQPDQKISVTIVLLSASDGRPVAVPLREAEELMRVAVSVGQPVAKR